MSFVELKTAKYITISVKLTLDKIFLHFYLFEINKK